MTSTTAPNGAAVYPFVVNVPYHPYRVALICDCGKPAAGFAGAIVCSGCSKVFSVSVMPLSHEPPRNSGEGTAVNGPMPLGEKPDASAPA